MRSVRLDIRVTPEERRLFAELASADGVSVSDVMRLLARREHAARFGSPGKPSLLHVGGAGPRASSEGGG
ncbi:MAG: hypothetical protein ACRENE_17180 [Polyangiaceae bacterium]